MILLPVALRKTFFLSAFVSFIFFLAAACTSTIYLHPDEHYQIVEFASYKLGITQLSQLPWEYQAHIRSAFQPFLCLCFFKVFNALGIHDHFDHLLILKILTALFSLFSIGIFCLSNLYLITEKYRKYYIVASFLFWYPYMYAVHFSSEAWSGNFLLIAIATLLLLYQNSNSNKKDISFFGIGLLLGLAFLCRYQTAIITTSLVAWLIWIRREKFLPIASLLVGGVVIMILGALIDHWFYGAWVCTPWGYVDSAFIHKHSDFGGSPFYMYLLWLFITLSPPIGFIVIVSLLLLFIKQPTSIYTFLLLPFILIHFFIAHKEFRFFFPIINFLPIVLFLVVQIYIADRPTLSISRIKATWRTLVVFNFLYLLIFVFLTSRFSSDSKAFCQRMHAMALKHDMTIYYIEANNDPFILPKATITSDMFPEYLRDKNMKHIKLSSACQIDSIQTNDVILFATNKYELETDSCMKLNANRFSINCRTTTGLLDKIPIKKYFGPGLSESLDMNTCLMLNVAKR
jgi:phosphatidylinositol glycan class B